MKIGIDAGCLATKKGGVYQMALNLFENLQLIDQKNQYKFYSWDSISRGWRYWGLPARLWRDRPDVFLGPAQALPVWCPCPTVVIIHDLGFKHWPQFYPQRRLQTLTRLAVKKATCLVAVSQTTKNDLIKFYNAPAAKIKVGWEGCNRKIFKPKPGRKKNYFLFVGAPKPSKNIAGLLKGFRHFCQQKAGYELWLVGGNFRSLINHQPQVKSLGFASQKKLIKLYQEAAGLVSPAFWEGFGLPLVEAMACGCPVLAGNQGSQPEIVGQAGILVDPRNSQEIGRAMIQLISQQQQLIKAGLKRAKLFSWQKFAQVVLEAINEVGK